MELINHDEFIEKSFQLFKSCLDKASTDNERQFIISSNYPVKLGTGSFVNNDFTVPSDFRSITLIKKLSNKILKQLQSFNGGGTDDTGRHLHDGS